MDELVGKWKLQHEKDDTFEKYLKAVGLMLPLCKMGGKATLVEDIRKVNDTKWSLSLSAAIRKSRVEFELDEEVEETTIDGRKCKTTFTLENGELVQYQHSLQRGVPDTCVHRQRIDQHTVVQTMEAVGTGVKTVRRYLLQET